MPKFQKFGKNIFVIVIAIGLLFVMPLTALAGKKTKSVE